VTAATVAVKTFDRAREASSPDGVVLAREIPDTHEAERMTAV
jgi:hypothetical protein